MGKLHDYDITKPRWDWQIKKRSKNEISAREP